MAEPPRGLAVARLLQLASPSLPVGAFAYSEGLETAVMTDRIGNVAEVTDWLQGVFDHCVVPVDLAVASRLHAAWSAGDIADVSHWSGYLLATRETEERRDQERHLGHALATLLSAMGFAEADDWRLGRARAPVISFAALWSLAAVRWGIARTDSLAALAWAWFENQVLAAVKLVPLGQTAGQRILFELAERIPTAVERALVLPDEAIGGSLPGVALASAEHETLYTRLYRS